MHFSILTTVVCKRQWAIALLSAACCAAFNMSAADETKRSSTNTFITGPLSLVDAVNVALRQNPDVRRAQADLEATRGLIIQTRAVAIPKVGITGNYNAVQDTDIDQPPGLDFAFGSDQSWRTQLQLVQSIYEGGRMASALRTATLLREKSLLDYHTVLADTVLAVQVAYYDVLLAEQQIIVRERSIELLTSELNDTKRRYEAGTIPRFNVLRAEVELANERPNLSRARNAFRISKNVLSNRLGFTIPRGVEEVPLQLSDKLTADPLEIDLSRAIQQGLSRRTELESLRKAQDLRSEEVVSARAGYKPSLQAFAGYDVHSSMFSDDLTDQFHGWIAGVQMTWNIFDGMQSRGRVIEAKGRLNRAAVDLDDAQRNIELEVRTAHSTFVESKEVLESTSKVVEEAEEALRLASARNQAGTGTQLDVLSARTALTEAETIQNEALRNYSVARARLERAVGMNLPKP